MVEVRDYIMAGGASANEKKNFITLEKKIDLDRKNAK